MALPSSGPISMSMVNAELGISPVTTQISLNQSTVRTLFAKTTAGSAIAMSDGYGKSNATQPQITGTLGSWDSSNALTSSSLSSNRTVNYYKYFYMSGTTDNGYNSAYGGNSIGFTVTGGGLTYEWQYLSYYGIQNTTNCTPVAYNGFTMLGSNGYNDAISGGNTNTLSFTAVYGYYAQNTSAPLYRGVGGYWRLKASNSAGTIYSPWTEVSKYWSPNYYDCNCGCDCEFCCISCCEYCCQCDCDENGENCTNCCGNYCNCVCNCDYQCNCSGCCDQCTSGWNGVDVGSWGGCA